MSYQYVNVVTINKVAVIEFNYGSKLNALSKVFIDDLMQALSDLKLTGNSLYHFARAEWIQSLLRRPRYSRTAVWRSRSALL